MARKSLVLILLALFAIGADAVQVTHFNLSGDMVSAQFADALTFVTVDAARTGDSTLLSIFSGSTDPTTGNFTFLQGIGLVPGANLSVNPGRLTATVSTELANDPGITVTSTVFDQFGNFISQTTISSGSINISFKKNAFFSSSSTGVRSDTFGNVTVRQELNQSSVSASASGSFLGSAVTSAMFNFIGTNHSNSITFTKN